MPYLPIESYGLIGDLHSAALVGTNGSIDFCCLPRFDSPAVFCSILDSEKGGFFRIEAPDLSVHKQMYLPETNLLLTRFLGPEGVGELLCFMPTGDGGPSETHEIVRVVRAIRGQVRFELECRPTFNFGRDPHTVDLRPTSAVFSAHGIQLGLSGPVPLRQDGGAVRAEFTLQRGETVTFVLRHQEQGASADELCQPLDGAEQIEKEVAFWRRWLSKCTYRGRWREMVYRSALALKLLTYRPTGAIVAAPTCGLPESIGGSRNWDYRYTWIRDGAFTVYAFMRLGFFEEASQFMEWLQARVREEAGSSGPLNVMYRVDGSAELPEQELTHLSGYRDSRPVRIGNAASNHRQLDIYGELIDSVYLHDKYGSPVHYELWVQLRRMLDWVCQNWDQPDESIWEVRGGRRDYTFSKMQCWVALDRGIRLATKRGLPLDQARMIHTRDKIYEAIMSKGWSASRNSFVQSFGSEALDASALMMPLMLFLSPTDPRMLSTLDALMGTLVSDSLVHRYELGQDGGAGDGLPGSEGTFSICTCWLVEALTRAGRLTEARYVFEKMLTYANHLGLFAEEVGPEGQALGNFPQAFTHLGLISAAFNLDRELNEPGQAASYLGTRFTGHRVWD